MYIVCIYNNSYRLIIYSIYLDLPRVSNFSPEVCFWWFRGAHFRPSEDSGLYMLPVGLFLLGLEEVEYLDDLEINISVYQPLPTARLLSVRGRWVVTYCFARIVSWLGWWHQSPNVSICQHAYRIHIRTVNTCTCIETVWNNNMDNDTMFLQHLDIKQRIFA